MGRVAVGSIFEMADDRLSTMTTNASVRPSNMCMPSKKLHADCDGTVIIWLSQGQISAPGRGRRSVERCPCKVCNHPPVE